MGIIIMGVGIVSAFVLAFLIDISINLRRVDAGIKKMLKKYEDVHGPKA